ncbi:predicted protein [Nematostella vectensis]|uniref:Uncharacterized protein n=1 Tax=Nematostella vectensis TaxID=45351 RepID=A7SUV3_NEMVE|nr:predicted protein [Nematostella vectensis]|eukprot:XP_001624606.1 predicted protein [Nematostella vectensis]
MLAFNRKNPKNNDPVREILARIEEKQSKTGLSLFAPHEENQTPLPSVDKTSAADENVSSASTKSSFFPDLKTAREKAQSRITANLTSQQIVQPPGYGSHKTKRVPHHLPGNKKSGLNLNQTFPPSNMKASSVWGDEKLNSLYNGNALMMNKESIDININPFGYNRKTLAFDNRNINYVVEWPETWPFKIMINGVIIISYVPGWDGGGEGRELIISQVPGGRLSYQEKGIGISLVPGGGMGNYILGSSPSLDEFSNEHIGSHARVLAPVDPPNKPHPIPNKPFLESVRRQPKKSQSRESRGSFYLKEAGVSYKREESLVNLPRKKKISPDEESKSRLAYPLSNGENGTEERDVSTTVSSVDNVTLGLARDSSPNKLGSVITTKGESSQSTREHAPPCTPEPPEPLKEEEPPPEKLAKEVVDDIVNQILAEDEGVVI